MKSYPSYKDSGVPARHSHGTGGEWIGEIPSHWDTKSLRYSFNIQKGKIPKLLVEESGENLIPYLSTDVLRTGLYNEFCDKSEGVIVEKDDLLILWDGSKSGEIFLGMDGILSSTMSKLHLKDVKLDRSYTYYLMKYYEKDFKNNTIGMGIPHMDGNHLKSSKIIVPPKEEQSQIVSFLDNKTQKIDELIEKTEKKIELLKEKRTSLINHCVTKGLPAVERAKAGLNPNVEMKDSGVPARHSHGTGGEWIGEIPSEWDSIRLKYFSTLLTEKEDTDKDDIKISPENVESHTGVCFNLYSEYEGKGVKFKSGDILLNKLRLYLVKILLPDYDGFSMGEMIVIRLNENVSNRYYFYLLFNQGLIDLLDSQSTGIKVPRVSPEIIMGSYLPHPPKEEQTQIVEYLDKQTQKIDSTIEKETQRIELLKEYRQSLISEVVTGKVDVRGWKG